jgi:hypothetical protein
MSNVNCTASTTERIYRWYNNDTTGSLNEWLAYPRMTSQRNTTIFQWLWNIVLTTIEGNQTFLKSKNKTQELVRFEIIMVSTDMCLCVVS